MRILHCIATLGTGGAEHLMVDLLPALRDLGNDVELLVISGVKTTFYEQLSSQGIRIHSLGQCGNIYKLSNAWKMARHLHGYDIVHTHTFPCQLFAALSHCKCHIVTTEHSTTNHRRNKWVLRSVDRWMYGRYDAIVCISDQARDNLVNHLGCDRRISVINNGIDCTKFAHPIKDITLQTAFVITMVASMRDAKDQDTLIKAMPLLPDNYCLQLVGDGERRTFLEELATKLGIAERVNFMGLCSNVTDLLAESDVAVLSSHWEGFGLAAVESMASGTPTIASDVGGLREIVKDYGILFPHRDHLALAAAIRSLCENPQYYHEVAERCQAKAKHYDISLMAQKYNELYQTII